MNVRQANIYVFSNVLILISNTSTMITVLALLAYSKAEMACLTVDWMVSSIRSTD